MFGNKEIYRQTLAISPVSFNEFSMGLGYGWIAPIISMLENSNGTLSLNTEQASWVASIQDFGRMIGPVIAGTTVDLIGRKFLLQVCAATYFISWLIITIDESVTAMLMVRLLFGVAVGINDVVSSIYLGENCSPKSRGIFGTMNVAFYNGGILFEYVVATYCTYRNTAIINTAIALVILLWSFFLKEPAQFLIMKGRLNQAKRTFEWLHGDPETKTAQIEYEKIVSNVKEENLKKASIKDLLTSSVNYKSVLIILTLNILAVATGSAAVSNFVSVALESSPTWSPHELTILFGLIQFFAVCISSLVIEKFDRRTVLLFCSLLTMVAHTLTAFLYYYQRDLQMLLHFPWLVFFTICASAVIFASGIDPMLYVTRAELFPQSIKPVGACASIIGNSLSAFLTGKVFLIVAEEYGIYVNFVFFAIAALAMFIFVYKALPETRGKTLVEIQEYLRRKL